MLANIIIVSFTDDEFRGPRASAIGTRTSSSGCQMRHRSLAHGPAPAELGTSTSGKESPEGTFGPLWLPSPIMTLPGLFKNPLHLSLIVQGTGQGHTNIRDVKRWCTSFPVAHACTAHQSLTPTAQG